MRKAKKSENWIRTVSRSLYFLLGLQASYCHLLILCAGPTVVGIGIDADATTGQEESGHLYVLRIHEFDEVFHYDVDAVLMEIAVIAKREQIEFEALALHHSPIRDVHYLDLSKIGLTRDGA